MQIKNYPSKFLDNAVNEFAKLPGIGHATALRLVLHLLRNKIEDVELFTETILQLKREIKYCAICNNISDTDICRICADRARQNDLVCVVESIRDVMAIESTMHYNGLYHMLGGIISPMDGIGPDDLSVGLLEKRVAGNTIREIIFALSTTMEGDTTCFYIYRKLKNYNITFSTLARGVSLGDELHYTDEATLGNSIIKRTKYENTL